MATERNDNNFGGRYLIQDHDHMSEIRPVTDITNRRPSNGSVSNGGQSARQQPAKRQHAAGARTASHAAR